jgi:hypothetical protein
MRKKVFQILILFNSRREQKIKKSKQIKNIENRSKKDNIFSPG